MDPALRPGDLLQPSRVLADDDAWDADLALLGGMTPGSLWGGGTVLATAADKAALHRRSGAVAVDLESAAVARAARRHGLPFAVVRAVCDPAERDLPPAALVALDPAGRIGLMGVLASVLAHPRQLPALLALGADAARARRALSLWVRERA